MRMRGYHVRSKVTSCTSKMVFFTCNACGSSLKKNQVEKHYQSECPRCEVLSCMDCGRDFHGDEYAGHTKCISEAEKYQGGLFRESGKAGGGGKGEKKQQEWLEVLVTLICVFYVCSSGILKRIRSVCSCLYKLCSFAFIISCRGYKD